jgi:hypothetical protein
MEDNELELNNVVLPGQMGFDFGKKRTFNKLIGQIEYYPVSRTFVFILAIVSSVLVNVGTLAYTLLKIGELPDKVPFIYNYIEKIWVQLDKFLLILNPFLLIAVEMTVIYYCFKVSFIDRRLSTISLALISVFNLLVLISAIQIFTLVS